jgi:hypothetical protein
LPAKLTETEPAPVEESTSSKPIQREKRDNKKTLTEESKKQNNDTVTERIPSVSSKQILTTAREAALQAAIRHPENDLRRHQTIESKLAEALNPERESPGVSTLADGTIRVVTEWGFIYCIRPADEYRIPGPEDIPPLSVLCR